MAYGHFEFCRALNIALHFPIVSGEASIIIRAKSHLVIFCWSKCAYVTCTPYRESIFDFRVVYFIRRPVALLA
jgi:hypothetical protein